MQKRSKNTIFVFSVVFIIILGIILSITIHPEMIMNGGSPGCGLESAPPGAFILNQPESPDSDGIIYLDWTDSARVCHYNVYRHRIGSGDEKVVGGIDSTSFTDTVTENGNWYYKIDAYNRYGYGVGETWHTWSNLVLVNVEIVEPIPSAPIFNLILENPSHDGNFDFNWWTSTGATSYNLYRSVDNGVTYNLYKSGITGTEPLIGSSDSGLTNGNYWYKVSAVNEAGESGDSNPQGVVVAIPNNLPTATIISITPNPATQGRDTITFTGSGSDTDGTIVAYQWLLTDNTVLSNSDSFTKSADDFNIGDTTIYFRVKDNGGDWSAKVSMLLTIEETPLNEKPTAIINSIEPISATQGVDTITFRGSGTDTDGNIVAYQWLLTGDVVIGESATITKSADDFEVGDITIYFKVKDDDGDWSDKDSKVLTIKELSNEKPTAIIISITPISAEQGVDTIYFSGSGTDSDGTITEYEWSSSIDGILSSLSSFSKSADDLSVGTHTIYLKVKDDDNEWSNQILMSLTIRELGDEEVPEDSTGMIILFVVVIVIGIPLILVARKLRKKVI